jgi:hypothetical protein
MSVSTHDEQVNAVLFDVITDDLFRLAPFKKDPVIDARFFEQILGMCGLFMPTATVFAGNDDMTFKVRV